MTGKNIWCLFSVANNYDQPPNNLEAWWGEKPDIAALAEAAHIRMGSDDAIIAVVRCHQGETARFRDIDWRLEKVAEGVLK